MPIPALKVKSPRSWEDKGRFSDSMIAQRRAAVGRREEIKKPLGGGYYRRRGEREKSYPRFFRKLLKLAGAGIIALVIFVLGALMYYSGKVPTREEMIIASQGSATKIYDRTGEHILYFLSGSEKRVWVPLDQIPEHVRWAVIAIEDDQFYEHHGFDFPALVKVALHEIFGIGPQRGGSTITQQLVKNAVLSPEKTYKRKLKELIFSYYLEKKFSKDEILELYFNVVPYGSTAYGGRGRSRNIFWQRAEFDSG